jgi:hypothetical protein
MRDYNGMTLDQLVTNILKDMTDMYEFPYHEIIGQIAVLKRTEPKRTDKIEGLEDAAKYLKRHIELAKSIDSKKIIKRHLVLKQGHDEIEQAKADLQKLLASKLSGDN